jgi:hypothetical protein
LSSSRSASRLSPPLRPTSALAPTYEGNAMTFDNILGAIAIMVIMVYITIALIRPERF